MNKEEKKDIIERLRYIRFLESKKIEENGMQNEIKIDDVKYLGTASIIQEIDGEEVNKEISVYSVIEGKTTKYYFDDECVAYETEHVGKGEPAIIIHPEWQKIYEGGEPIKDIIKNLKQKEIEEQEKPKEKREVVSLNELEKKEELLAKEMADDEVLQNKKKKPTNVLQVINPNKAKSDYWKTLKQEFGLPDEVATLAFSYPTTSEERIDKAHITVHMLDKDGYIIDDIDVNDYFEFDSTTGNNPINDNTIRFEEDENKGKVQVETHNTMIRLKARNESGSYISLEQKNHFGDTHDVNMGKKVVGGTKNVEKQLETDRFKVWDSDVEKLVNGKKGIYNTNLIYEEADKNKAYSDDGYISKEDADGHDESINSMKSINWKELAIKWGFHKDGKPDEEKAKKIYEEYRKNNQQLSHEEIVEEVGDDLDSQIRRK